jgi:mono/diheme cytochrome c family protein
VIALRHTITCGPLTAALLVCTDFALADERAERGRALLTENCAQCHALGRTGESPLPSAPPFRRIGERMDMDELMARMREGLSSGHRDMPMFRFSLEDRRAIRSYLNTVQD